jgi:hypothetical protein
MTFDYEIYPEARIIVLRYAGQFTLGALKVFAQRLWADARYSRSFDGLVDLTDARLGVAREDFLALVEFVRGHEQTSLGRWAAITTSPLATACGLIYQRALARRHAFEVFATTEAAAWFLGVDLGNAPLLGKGFAPHRL